MKSKLKNLTKIYFASILAGISISMGCVAYMICENKICGATLFTLGLLLVLTRKYDLFTGKVGYLVDNKPKYILDLFIIWFGNLCGTAITALIINQTKLLLLKETAILITNNKLSQTPISAFIMAIMCGIIIYLAVENFKNNTDIIGKYTSLLLLIPTFIICGYEHCVANMFYFIFANTMTIKSILYIIIISIGNSVGSILFRTIEKFIKRTA